MWEGKVFKWSIRGNMPKKGPELKGYRIRVTIDIPVWEYNRKAAKRRAVKLFLNRHTASKIMGTRIIKEGPPDNKVLFSTDSYNPSKRGSK